MVSEEHELYMNQLLDALVQAQRQRARIVCKEIVALIETADGAGFATYVGAGGDDRLQVAATG